MTKERLEELKNISAPTWEGLVVDEGLKIALKKIDPECDFEICKGKEMNEYYGLTGDNAYPDTINIVILTKWSIDMMDWKLKYCCRWLDDVIYNNILTEEENNA